MHTSSRFTVFPLLVGCGLLGSLAAGCSKEKAEESTTPEPAAAVEKAVLKEKAEVPPVGFGTVSGKVAFSGKVPDAKELPRKSDPVCAAKPMKDNAVLVAGGMLQDVLVRIAPLTVKGTFAEPTKPVAVHQQDCMYVPRVQGAVAGQVVQIENEDKTMHNVHTYRGQETILNQGQPSGSPPIKKDSLAKDPAILKFKCDVHPWMTGFVVVTDHPFFQTTGADGSFKLEKVPAGQYTLEAWHSTYGVKTVSISVEPNKTAEATFSYDGTEKAD